MDNVYPEKALESTVGGPIHHGVGLALGSGVARGFAHIGVLRTLFRHGIYPGIIAGTSIGALVGAAYLMGRLDELEAWARALNKRRIFSYLDLRIRGGGLIGGDKLFALMNKQFGETLIENLPLPYAAIATDITSGHEVWLQKGRLADCVRASFALPGIFAPVTLNARNLVDGALVNPCPVSVCQAMGAHMTIAVDLNADTISKALRSGHYLPSGEQAVRDIPVEGESWAAEGFAPFSTTDLAGHFFRKETKKQSVISVMVSALGILQDRITRSRLAGDPPDVHIKPRIGHIGLLEFDRAAELIDLGAKATEQAIPEIRAALALFFPHERLLSRDHSADIPLQH